MAKRVLPKPDLPQILLQPIEMDDIKPPTFLDADGEYEKRKRYYDSRIAIERQRKLLELIKYYGLNPQEDDFWRHFCIRLTVDFIDGFKVVNKKSKGAKKIWPDFTTFVFCVEVQEIMRLNPNLTAKEACERLSWQEEWKTLVRSQQSQRSVADNLYERYLKSINTPIIKDLFALFPDPAGVIKHFKNIKN